MWSEACHGFDAVNPVGSLQVSKREMASARPARPHREGLAMRIRQVDETQAELLAVNTDLNKHLWQQHLPAAS